MSKWWLALIAPMCFGQAFELGALAGGGLARSAMLSSGTGSAAAGFSPGPAFGALLYQDWGSRFGGEVRYEFLMQNVRLSSGGTKAAFSSQAHAFHYQMLAYARNRSAQVRPYVVAGGGYKRYRGTGDEVAYRPLMEDAWLTRTAEWKPMVVAGGGIKVALSGRLALRMEVLDQLTPVPTAVIAPATGVRVSGWIHDLVPTVALVWRSK